MDNPNVPMKNIFSDIYDIVLYDLRSQVKLYAISLYS